MLRLLQGLEATLAMSWHDGDSAVDPGTVTVSITDAVGNTLADEAATSGTGTDERTYVLETSDTATLTVLTVTWSSSAEGDTVERYEVIGGSYVTLGEMRSLTDLSDTTKFPTDKVSAAVDWWTDLVENHCGVSYVPRYGRFDRRVRVGDRVYLKPQPREIQQATVDGTAVSTDAWHLYDDGTVDRPAAGGRLVVHYTHGFDEPDNELHNAAVIAIRAKLLADRSGMPSRQTLITNDLGTVRLSQPGTDRPTGFPEVDRVLNDHRFTAAMVA